MQSADTEPRRALWPVAIPLAAFGAIIGFLAYMLVQEDRDPSVLPSPLVGQPAPSIAGPSLFEGTPDVSNAVFGRGEPVLVNFFASWCVPCKVEHPVLTSLVEDEGLALIGVNYKDETDEARRFLDDLGNPYDEIAVDGMGGISVNWGVTGLPETFVVDGSGTVVYRHFGPVLPEQREDLIAIVEDGL